MQRLLIVPLVLFLLMTVPVLGQGEAFVRWVRFIESWTLDPIMATDAGSTEVLVKIYDTLIQLKSGTTQIEPGLAESWEISPEGTKYTFHLREGVLFHNGAEMTARDVKYSIDRLIDPATAPPWARQADGITNTSVINDHTITIEMARPSASLLSRLAQPCFSIIPSQGLDPQSPVGTGPYRLTEQHSGGNIVLEAFDQYWGGKPCVDRYLLHPEDDNEAIWQAFREGEVSLVEVPSTQWEGYVEQYLQDPQMQNYTTIVPELVTYWLIFNCQEWPFKEKAIRNAVCCALQKEEVLDQICEGRYIEAHGPLPPGLWGFSQDLYDDYRYSYNPEKARQLLDSAGIIDTDGDGVREYEGRPLILEYSSYVSRTWQTASQIHVEDLRTIGIETTYREYDFPTLLGKIESGKFTITALGWGTGYADPEDFMVNWESANIPEPNAAWYRNPIFDDLAQTARAVTDPDQRLDLYAQMSAILQEDNPHWWFYHPAAVYVWQPWVPCVEIGGMGFAFEKMVTKSCAALYRELAGQLEELFSEAEEHIKEAEDAGMDTDQMEAYLSAAQDFWAECDGTMAQTYLEGILEINIPEPSPLPLLSILGLVLLPTLLRRRKA